MADRNIRLTIAYDGTDFLGWQVQSTGRTVQGVIEEGLRRMHGHDVRIACAGRTDTGVHARGQVANFVSDIDSIPGNRFRDAVNSYIPKDVRVVSSSVAEDGFHARYWARARIYTYHLFCGAVHYPHLRRYSLHVKKKLDCALLNRYASVLVGEHDFSTFAGSRDMNESKVRVVFSSAFYPYGECIAYRIAADSFLYRMVRSIVGTILDHVETGKSVSEFCGALKAMSRDAAGPTAPSKGLFLDSVLYGDNADMLSSYVDVRSEK